MTDVTSEQFSAAFVAVMDYAEAHGSTPIVGLWEAAIDGVWSVALNGKGEPRTCSRAVEVPAFHCAVFWRGNIAGIINPYGGEFVVHENANEDLFIEAIRSAA